MSDLADLIALLVAAGGPTTLMERSPWPLHESLVLFEGDLAARDLVAEGMKLEMHPDAHVGLEIAGVGAAIYELINLGVFRLAGAGIEARLEVDADGHRAYRKKLMCFDLARAQTLQRVAQDWRARACTAEKTWARAFESRAEMSRRATPKRRQLAATF